MLIVIIGSGIAGAMATGAFKSLAPVVLSAQKEGASALSQHEAIMRIRDPRVGLLLGCDLEKVKIRKMVYSKGCLSDVADITSSNLYSLKAYGEIGDRSLTQLGDVERYLIKDKITIANLNSNCKVLDINRGKIVYQTTGQKVQTKRYDYCISTMPMPVMAKVCAIETESTFTCEEIVVHKTYLKVKSTVHQTIYVPELKYKTYRITLQGTELIVEAVAHIDKEELSELISLFGLNLSNITGEIQSKVQINGKLISIDETERRAVIFKATEKHNLFSLGRFAIWKPIRADHLLKDIDKIKTIIRMKDKYSLYKEGV